LEERARIKDGDGVFVEDVLAGNHTKTNQQSGQPFHFYTFHNAI
jgi:hypothetical protein